MEANKTNQLVIPALGAWALANCTMNLSSQEITTKLPFDQTVFVYLIILELLAVIVLLRFPRAEIARDSVDLALYSMLFEAVVLEAYFLNAALYNKLHPWWTVPVLSLLFNIIYWRLAFALFGYRFPPIGPYGWSSQAPKQPLDARNWAMFIAGFIILCEITLITMQWAWWYKVLPAATGLFILLRYIRPFADHQTETEAHITDLKDEAANWERMVEEAGERIIALQAQLADASAQMTAMHAQLAQFAVMLAQSGISTPATPPAPPAQPLHLVVDNTEPAPEPTANPATPAAGAGPATPPPPGASDD